MRIISRLLTGLTVLVLMAPCAAAQTAGTITVTGSTPEAFALTNASDGALTSTISLGVLTPGTGVTASALRTGTADVRLRSNKAYKVTAAATTLSVTSPGNDDGGSAIALTDIGFGIVGVSGASGANVASGHSDSIASGYDVSGGWPAPTNGLTPAFAKTLNDITGSTQILTGTRISSKGNLSTTDNFITVQFGVATLPQFFTPNGGFQSVVTLTLASQ